MQILKIPYKLDGLNEYTEECRNSKYDGNKCKRENEKIIRLCIRNCRLKKMPGAYFVRFTWWEATKQRDKDNVAFAKKFILDALQKEKITKGDDNRYLLGFEDRFVYGQGQGVVAEIFEEKEYEKQSSI
ncbi:MAG: hypothetical protein IJN27_01805 [Oscillospiraceae bacterium]|nr:hypothetical protein [Oscillospiraceae bacterium]